GRMYLYMKMSLSTIVIEGITNRRRGRPFPKSLHGMCYELAGREYEHIHNKPPAFQPSIRKWEAVKGGTNIEIEIRITEDEFYNHAMERLMKSNYLIVGSTEFEIIKFEGKKDVVLNFDEKVPSVPEVFKLNFATPTFFRKRKESEGGGYYYVTIPEPNMKNVLHSISKYLQRRTGFKTSFELIDSIANKIHVIHKEAKRTNVIATQTYSKEKAFLGHMVLDTTALDEEEADMFGKLIKIGSYSGVGHQKGFGFG